VEAVDLPVILSHQEIIILDLIQGKILVGLQERVSLEEIFRVEMVRLEVPQLNCQTLCLVKEPLQLLQVGL
jgi:hypothetical protein